MSISVIVATSTSISSSNIITISISASNGEDTYFDYDSTDDDAYCDNCDTSNLVSDASSMSSGRSDNNYEGKYVDITSTTKVECLEWYTQKYQVNNDTKFLEWYTKKYQVDNDTKLD